MRYEKLELNEDQLREKCLIKDKEYEPCAICGQLTNYIDYCSEQHICSEECMYTQNKNISRADMFDKQLLISYITEAAITFVTSDIMERVASTGRSLADLEKEDYRFKFEPKKTVQFFISNLTNVIDSQIELEDGTKRSCSVSYQEMIDEMVRCMLIYKDKRALKLKDLYIDEDGKMNASRLFLDLIDPHRISIEIKKEESHE